VDVRAEGRWRRSRHDSLRAPDRPRIGRRSEKRRRPVFRRRFRA
jgi:hypothetical protein